MNKKNLLAFHSVLSPMTVDCGGGLAMKQDERLYMTDYAMTCMGSVSQSVDLGQNNNPNTTPTKDYENV